MRNCDATAAGRQLNNMIREYYAYWYRLNDKEAFLIWYSNEKDGFVVNEAGFIPTFESKDDLKNYADKIQIVVDLNDPNLIELDSVKNWLNDGGKIKDYNLFLDVWNLFEDISVSTHGNFDNDKEVTNDLYDRIFWGCNIPAVTPEGESFTPTWTKKELKIIRETLSFGFKMFQENIKEQF